MSLELNFGDDLGVQVVTLEDCQFNSPPKIFPKEYDILDMMVEFIRLQAFLNADTRGMKSFHYLDVFAIDEVVLVLDDDMDSSSQGIRDVVDNSDNDHQTRSIALIPPNDRRGQFVSDGTCAHLLPPYS